mmetsp:Transcript_3176/g.8114  ORF Transcript_3176/g.8114 Transcript_3176/m.8114 type:complete len:501 (+) Transcript_3176:150-1652(+)
MTTSDSVALTSLAQELANFTIEDLEQMEEELEEDYDSITTDEDGDLSQEGITEDDDLSTAPGKDFALAVRSSEIISEYRNYLTDMESVSAENQRLANEMNSLRCSLGLSRAPRDDPHDGRLDYLHSIDIEESPSTRHSQSYPILRSRQIKRRILRTMVSVVVMGSVAVLYLTVGSTHVEHNHITDWDEELAEELQREEQTKEVFTEKTASRARGRQSMTPQHEDEEGEVASPAMKIVVGTIAHHKEVKVTPYLQDIVDPQKHDNNSADVDSGKSGGLDLKNSPTSKSDKLFGYESSTASKSKSGKNSKSNSGTGPFQSKSAKNSKGIKTSNSSKSTSKYTQMTGKKRTDIPPMPDLFREDDVKDETRDPRLHFEAASILYEAITRKYRPMFYDRSQGWTGRSFSNGDDFCASHYSNHVGDGVMCPYEAYCPEGPNSLPFGGYRPDPTGGGMYAPIMDATEHWLGWVQLSLGHPCVAYNFLDPAPTEEQTGYIMCCRDVSR